MVDGRVRYGPIGDIRRCHGGALACEFANVELAGSTGLKSRVRGMECLPYSSFRDPHSQQYANTFSIARGTHLIFRSTMDNTLPPEELLVHTLALLEWRLNRLEFLLDGGVSQTKNIGKDGNVLSRIQKMEHALQQLSSKSDTIKILLNLRVFPPPFKSQKSTDNPRITLPTSSCPRRTASSIGRSESE